MDEPIVDRRVVVITGASSGFGRGAALGFARRGARLALAARRGEVLDELVEECEALGAEAISVPTDVSCEEDVGNLARATVESFGRIDVWINDAGVGALGRFEDIPLADHMQVLETDLHGTLYGSWFAYRQFLRQGTGILINLASELGKHTVPYYTSYVAAKHGVVGLGSSLRQEIDQAGHEGIHVCTVLPTAHDTPFFDHAANYTGHQVRAPQPLHDPQEVVEAILRLADDPKDTKIVGSDGLVKVLMKSLAPALAEKMAAKQMHENQMERSPIAPDSPGAVRRPMREGTTVSAGRREREQEA